MEASSSRPISSKLLGSVRIVSRSDKEEWKEEDLEDLELVMPGGEAEPGSTADS